MNHGSGLVSENPYRRGGVSTLSVLKKLIFGPQGEKTQKNQQNDPPGVQQIPQFVGGESSLNREYLPSNTECICKNTYFENSVSNLCEACNATCLWCTGASTNDCTSCNSADNRSTLSVSKECPCDDGWVDVSLVC